MSEAYIVQALRTAGGRRGGRLAGWHPADMAGEVLSALVSRSGIDPATVDDVIIGCVTQAGEQAFHVGRNAVMASTLPNSVPAVTIDRQCGSSQQALHFAAQAVMSGTQDVVIAGGVESMTRVPMGSSYSLHMKQGIGTGPFSPRIRQRYGVEHFSQFVGAQMMADKYGLSRDDMDRYALESHRRAAAATTDNRFACEILPLEVDRGDGVREPHVKDEGIRYDASFEGIASVKPLQENGTITAANASQICDGASAALIVNGLFLKRHNLTPLARIHHLTVTAGDPVIMLDEPINATRRALKRTGLSMNDIDLFEVNEAFASVPLAWIKELGADQERVNANGGAIALGHPLGATGTKLMATLVHALRARKKRYGLQTMCEGGGIANVTIIEAL
jgi:acetyl-CoA C-acetyltransferase